MEMYVWMEVVLNEGVSNVLRALKLPRIRYRQCSCLKKTVM